MTPLCPLCGKSYTTIVHKGIEVYLCRKCKVFIRTDDPCVPLGGADVSYEDDEEDMQCVVCRAKMRMFFRSDGYVKGVCTNHLCKAVLESDRPDDGAEMAERTRNRLC